jgi:hypothetical protein
MRPPLVMIRILGAPRSISRGDFRDAVVLAQFGDVDLNALSE